MACAKEIATQDSLGIGPGPVLPTEQLVLAVFQGAPINGSMLAPTAFDNKQLVKGDVSLARVSYTTRAMFDAQVVAPKAPDKLIGVVICEAATLRALDVPNPTNPTVQRIRSVCVIDKIVAGDHEGHAALEYTEDQTLITNGGTRGKLRLLIAAQLAHAFGNVVSPDTVPWKANLPAPTNPRP